MVEKLKAIVNSAPYMDSAVIVDEDGLIIYKYERKDIGYDVEEMVTQVINSIVRLSEAAEEIEDESLKEIVIFLKKHIIISYKLINQSYLIVSARYNPLYAKTRFLIRTKLGDLEKAL